MGTKVAQTGSPEGSGGGGGGSFTPLQQFFADQFALGSSPTVPGAFGGGLQLNTWQGNGFGTTIVNTDHIPSRSTCMQLSIQAGTSGFPGDGETPPGNGLWGFFLNPPASRGAQYYGGQGDIFHFAFKMKLSSTVNMATNINDGAQKFILYASPDTGGTSGKNDVHFCQDYPGFAMINEYDPNANVNNTYPSTRSPTNSPAQYAYARNNWGTIERGTLFHSNPALAWDRIWIDDILALEFSGHTITWRDSVGGYHTQTVGNAGKPTLPLSTAFMEFVYFLTYWNNHPSVNSSLLVDGITTVVGENNLNRVDNFGNKIIGSANIV